MGRQAIKIDIVGDATKFNNATKSATKSAGKFGNVLQGIGQGIGISAFTNIASLASKAATSVVDFATDSVAAASDLREALALSDQVFEDSSDVVSKWGDTTAETMGTAKSAAVEMAAIFGTQFKSAGLSIDEVADKSIELTELAADLGSAFNRSSEEAATALRSGLLGEAEPMRRFGSNLSAARVEAYLLAKGVTKVGGTFTDGQKIMARYALILEDTADSAGMFGRDTESLADAQKILQATFEDMQATIGEELLPIMVDLSTWAAEEGVPAFKDLLALIGDVGDGLSFMVDRAQWLIDAGFTPWDSSSNQLTKSMGTLDRSVRDVSQSADEGKGPIAGLEGGIDDAGDAASDATKEMDKFRDSLDSAYATIIENSYSPEQLRLGLEKAKLETADLTTKLRELEAVKNPTAETRADILDTKLALSQSKEEVDKLTARLGLLNGASLAELQAAWKTLLRNGIKPNSAEAQHLLNLLRAAEGSSLRTSNSLGNMGARATGGPASGLTLVGEKGPEIVDLPTGSYVHSNAESMRMASSPSGGGRSAGGMVVNVNINEGAFIDGPSIDRLTNLIAQRLNYATGL